MRLRLALLLCRVSRFFLRLLGRGGTTVPGRIALAVYPSLLQVLAEEVTTVVVTGTNGKTTSVRMIEQGLQLAGMSHFTNRSGANLIAGITAEYVDYATWGGKPRKKYAVIECDEEALARVCHLVNPRVILLTNLFKDQLGRFASVYHTRAMIAAGIQLSPSSTICLNGDDFLSASLARGLTQEVVYYGMGETACRSSSSATQEENPLCLYCHTPLSYYRRSYAHLGAFYCSGCGFFRPALDVAIAEAQLAESSSLVSLRLADSTISTRVNLPGAYNLYNAVGASAVMQALALPPQIIAEALATFQGGFGRMERFQLEGVPVQMILVKNPAGFNQVISYLADHVPEGLAVICLNNQDADGTDISWIDEVNFAPLKENFPQIWLAGSCAEEVAKRLELHGISRQLLTIYTDYRELLQQLLAQQLPVYILPSYSAMMDLREVISRRFGLKRYWES